jgi:AGCS family alanine or glycine:cation symporter
MKVEEAWSIGDIFNGMMAFTNLIGIVGLAGLAVMLVKSYLKKFDTRKNKNY